MAPVAAVVSRDVDALDPLPDAQLQALDQAYLVSIHHCLKHWPGAAFRLRAQLAVHVLVLCAIISGAAWS
jgi:hypothetical protein